MSNFSRRWFLGVAAGLPLLPVAAQLAPTVVLRPGYEVIPDMTMEDFLTQTLRARTGVLADSITTNNALLMRLKNHHGRPL